MKKCVNGEYIEMTAEEIAELEQALANQPEIEKTPEERIAELEAFVRELLQRGV